MSDSTDRKPKPSVKEPAQVVLTRFLKDNGILLGTTRPQIDFTNNGAMVVSAPGVFAVYEEEAQRDSAKAN